jgi:hypothetical protein
MRTFLVIWTPLNWVECDHAKVIDRFEALTTAKAAERFLEMRLSGLYGDEGDGVATFVEYLSHRDRRVNGLVERTGR